MKRMRTTSVIFFNDTATTEIYTLSLHDALPISASGGPECGFAKWKTTQTRRAATRVDDLTPPGHGEIIGGRAGERRPTSAGFQGGVMSPKDVAMSTKDVAAARRRREAKTGSDWWQCRVHLWMARENRLRRAGGRPHRRPQQPFVRMDRGGARPARP